MRFDDVKNFIEIPLTPETIARFRQYSSGEPTPHRIKLPIEGRAKNLTTSSCGTLLFIFIVTCVLFYFINSIHADNIKRGIELCENYGSGMFEQIKCGFYLIWPILAIISVNAYVFFYAATTRAEFSEASKRPPPHLRIDQMTFWHMQLSEPIPLKDIERVSALGGPTTGYGRDIELECKNAPPLVYTTVWNDRSKPSRLFRFHAHRFQTTAGEDLLDALKALVEAAHNTDSPSK